MSPRPRKQPQTSAGTPHAGRSREMAKATMTPRGGAPVPQSAAPTSPESRMDRISQRAYEIYQRRGGQGGHEMDDWLQAEREIDSEA